MCNLYRSQPLVVQQIVELVVFFQRMVEQEISTQGVLHAFYHIFPTVPNTSLLEDKHASLLGLDVKVSISTP